MTNRVTPPKSKRVERLKAKTRKAIAKMNKKIAKLNRKTRKKGK